MQLLDLQQRREEQELAQMQEDLGRNNNGHTGHQSEPTTPPEYRDTNSGFPSVFSRPNRYSTSSLTSPPGLYNRPGRSGSQLTSPQSGIMQSRLHMDDKLPSKSVPGSRRNSDEDEKEEAVRQDPTSHRSSNAYVLASFSCLTFPSHSGYTAQTPTVPPSFRHHHLEEHLTLFHSTSTKSHLQTLLERSWYQTFIVTSPICFVFKSDLWSYLVLARA